MALPKERQAIIRCQQGDLTGLEVLFELHRQAVLRTAYGIVGRHHMAEDVTQQVFVELFSAIKRFDRRRPFAPWLYRIVVNISLKELRRRDHRDLSMDEAADQISFDPKPDRAAEESETRAQIWAAIQSLSPKHRAVVVLRYYHGFGEAEMSQALGCRRGTVKSRLHSALRRLEQILNAERALERVSGNLRRDAGTPATRYSREEV